MTRRFISAVAILVMAAACTKQPPVVTPQPPPGKPGFHSPDEVRMETKVPSAPAAPVPVPPAASATVTPNTAFQIAADADGQVTTEYRLEKDGGATQTKPVSALANGVIQFALPAGVPVGTHVFTVRAVRIIPQGEVSEYFSPPWMETVVAGQPFVKTVTVPPAAAPTLPVTHIKLYRANIVVQTQPVTGPSVTFSVTGLPAGSGEFKYGTVTTASAPTELASPATASAITVVASSQVVNSLTTDASKYVAGAPITLTWTVASPTTTDWVGLFDVNTNVNLGKTLTNGAPTGKTTLPAPSFPTGGFYYARYCLASGFCPTISPAFFVEAAIPTGTDCVGVWSEWTPVPPGTWSACVNNVQTRTEQRTYAITKPATGTGKACEAAHGTVQTRDATQACTVDKDCQGTWSVPLCGTCTNGVQTCSRTFTMTEAPEGNGKACPVSPEVTTQSCTSVVLAPAMVSCRFTLRAAPPDSTLGWQAQWRENGTNVGSRDSSSPYDRTFNYSLGVSRKVDIVWSKSSVPTRTSDVTTLTCK